MKKKTISVTSASIYAMLITFIISIPILIAYYITTGVLKPEKTLVKSIKLYEFVIVVSGSIVVHELIHAAVFSVFAKDTWKNVKIGFQIKTLTPYAHCKVPLKKIHYELALMMPGIILGLIPVIIAFNTASILLLYYGLFMLMGAGGDIVLLFMLRKVPNTKKILDHDSEVGFYIL